METIKEILNFENAVDYHYGKFPPKELDSSKLLQPLASASEVVARYDQMLKLMHNSDTAIPQSGMLISIEPDVVKLPASNSFKLKIQKSSVTPTYFATALT